MARPVPGVAAVSALGALAICAPSVTAAAPARISCETFELSPEFATDGTMLCIARHKPRPQDKTSGVNVFLSTDRGRSWKKQAGTGLVVREDNFWTQVVFSPRYKHDRTIYVQEVNDGLYRTTDGGATFTIVDPLAQGTFGGPPTLTPLLTARLAGIPVPVGQEPEGAIAYAGGRLPAVVVPPARRPVPGSPTGGIAQFLIPAGFPAKPAAAVVSIAASAATPWRHEVALCTPQLACADTRLVLPDFARVLHAEVHPTAKHAPTIVIAHAYIGAQAWKTTVRRSTDAGRTYHRVAKLESLLDAVGKRPYSASVAAGPHGTLWLKADHSGWDTRTPRSQLLRSTDGGATWTRVAYSKNPKGFATAAGMPPPASDVSSSARSWIRVARDGRVFVLGGSSPYGASSIYCSTNLRTWRPTC